MGRVEPSILTDRIGSARDLKAMFEQKSAVVAASAAAQRRSAGMRVQTEGTPQRMHRWSAPPIPPHAHPAGVAVSLGGVGQVPSIPSMPAPKLTLQERLRQEAEAHAAFQS